MLRESNYRYALALKEIEVAGLNDLLHEEKVEKLNVLIRKAQHTCGLRALARVLSEDLGHAVDEQLLRSISVSESKEDAYLLIKQFLPEGKKE